MASFEVFLLIWSIFRTYGEKYSLHFSYTATSKSLVSGKVYEFYNSIELSDIQMSVCKRQKRGDFLKHLCEESERLFRNESEELMSKQKWLQINLDSLTRLVRTNDTVDVHVLQWRHGCAVEHHSNGSVILIHATDESAYDGETLISNLSMPWKPLVLDNGLTWERESVSSLERTCVDMLTNVTQLHQDGRFIIESPPIVYTSVRASGSSDKEILVCLATGFYPRHVQMEIRHSQMVLPDDQLSSGGIRPNSDGSFQLMKSLEIPQSERSQYRCVVKHQTLTEPCIISWDTVNIPLLVFVGLIITLVILVIVLLVYYLLRKCGKKRQIEGTPRTGPQLMRLEMMSSLYTRFPTHTIEFHEERRETRVGLAAALNTDSDEENTADDAHTQDHHETQSLCDTKVTPTAARGAMGSKNCSLPNFALEREDANQNSVMRNALLLPVARRCRSKNISLPNLTLERKDEDNSS